MVEADAGLPATGRARPPPRSSTDDPGARNLLRSLAWTRRQLTASLDYESTLEAVARQALPYDGSWCIVDLVEPGGTLRRLPVVHPDLEHRPRTARLTHGWPPARGDPLGVPQAVHTRRIQFIPEIDDEMLVREAADAASLDDLRALEIASIIVVPLLARENVLGVITFLGAKFAGCYEDGDIELAEDLASRCAIAIDDARLFRESERARALAVQVNEQLVLSSLREQELAEQAQSLRTATSKFLAELSHEIRTPVASIIGYAALLTDEDSGPLTATQRERLDRIRTSATHLVDLVTDVLDLKKAEAGMVRIRKDPGGVRAVIAAALEMMRPLAEKAGVMIQHETSGDDEGIRYVGDHDRVRQILLNLLSNAVKFTDSGGQVVIRCGRAEHADADGLTAGKGPWVFIEVEDTGVGIPAERMADVFTPFVQMDRGSSRGSAGTGLGLPISRELARRMGGELSARSREGEGSRFVVWLPEADN